MLQFVFNLIYDVSANYSKAVFCVYICDLLVHIFMKLAFGTIVKPGAARAFIADRNRQR